MKIDKKMKLVKKCGVSLILLILILCGVTSFEIKEADAKTKTNPKYCQKVDGEPHFIFWIKNEKKICALKGWKATSVSNPWTPKGYITIKGKLKNYSKMKTKNQLRFLLSFTKNVHFIINLGKNIKTVRGM